MGRLPVLLVLVALACGLALGAHFAEGDGASTAATPPPERPVGASGAPTTGPVAWLAAARAAGSFPERRRAEPRQATAPADPAPQPAEPPAPAQPQEPPAATAPSSPTPAPQRTPATARASRAIGQPWKGRLVDGVQLAAQGTHFFTWDWGRDVSPNAAWRRWGTDVLVEWLQAVVAGYRAQNPDAPRVGIADLSRTKGGDFGAEIAGGLGHASHQNGLDVDVLYPRRDRRELAPLRAAQVDRRLAQKLVDAFVQAGAEKAFVGHGVKLRGPKAIVVRLSHHDDHVHVRISKRALSLWRAPLGLR